MEKNMVSSEEKTNDSGLPENMDYLECGLPPFLQESIDAMIECDRKLASGEKYLHYDIDYCNLQSNINVAEVEQIISPRQAWYLREKYLGIKRE